MSIIAKVTIIDEIEKSFKKILNNKGPNIDPCRAPVSISFQSLSDAFTEIL